MIIQASDHKHLSAMASHHKISGYVSPEKAYSGSIQRLYKSIETTAQQLQKTNSLDEQKELLEILQSKKNVLSAQLRNLVSLA